MPLKNSAEDLKIATDHERTKWLSQKSRITQTAFISLTAFLLYACMYGIRKSFTVAEFRGMTFHGMDFKTLLIISQVVGYTLSKIIGIKVISEMKRSDRAPMIVVLTGIAEGSLILFNVVPPPANFIFLFFNGLPLGMIWGLVFAYLEGRRTTEILGTALSISFIVSSGFAKSVGKLIMDKFHLTDFQMPWVTGLAFYIPLLLLVWLIDKTPSPTPEDQLSRTKRIPMDRKQRANIFREFAVGLILLTVAYMLLTIYRDIRDNFAVDIWKSIGFKGNSMIYTISELPVALVVFAVMSSMILIKDNKKALIMNNIIVFLGFIIIGLGTFLLKIGFITPAAWIIILGLGTYMGYLPFNCLIFDRMIAAFGKPSNAGFFIYFADSFGYLGSVITLIFKNFSNQEVSWYSFLMIISYGISITGMILVSLSVVYFKAKSQPIAKDLKIYLT